MRSGGVVGKWIVVGIVAVLMAANYRLEAERTITCDELAKTLGDTIEGNETWNNYCAEQTDYDNGGW